MSKELLERNGEIQKIHLYLDFVTEIHYNRIHVWSHWYISENKGFLIHNKAISRNADAEMRIIMAKGAGKNNWALFLLLLAGIVIGSFIAQATAGISFLSWLNYGQSFGLTSPLTLDLGILVLTFGLSIKITIGSILGILIAIIIYHFI